MGGERQRIRISSKIDSLPEDVRDQVDAFILDTNNTYCEIADWLKTEGYEISKSSVGRYALRTSSAAQRLIEAQEQTKALVNVIKKNPDVDYTEAGMMMLMDGLIKKIAAAEEEFDTMPLDKVGRLVASISRTKVYKERVKQEMLKKIDLAFTGLESDLMKAIKADAELANALTTVLKKAKEKMLADD